VIAGCGVDQLRGDAHATAALWTLPSNNAPSSRATRIIDRLALVGERGIARDDEEPA
jgi:hypothetical protein